MEAVVYSHRAAETLAAELLQPEAALSAVSAPAATTSTTDAGWSDIRAELRDVMWEFAGIVRSDARLERGAAKLQSIAARVEGRFSERGVSPESVEARNLADTAQLVVRCARARKESRGLHYNTDYPFRDNELFLSDTVVKREAL